ncbi:CocE/NonD family hydrolase [Companilactobacillus furfuricola]|uniref:CocE/NonD family hydrolase n=1 Tax=Companilactobacillus furfuricola TaxID=1462575 RepID=UPI000F774CF5|nr:CocE/NonD family hydrolase [Companilactobacillus furfuricola]
MNKRTFKKRSYTSMAALFLAGTIFSTTGNAYAATVDESTCQDKTDYAIEQVKETGLVTLSGTDQFDLQKFADAVNAKEDGQQKVEATTNVADQRDENDPEVAMDEATTETSESDQEAATDENTTDSVEPAVDNETAVDSEESSTDATVSKGEGTEATASDSEQVTDDKNLITLYPDQTTTDETATVPDVINKPNVTASSDDELSMEDLNKLTPKTYKTLLGKITGFIGDKVTDVTSGIAAALGYPLLFSRFGTQALSDFRTLLSPTRYDVSNTWTSLDEQYDPEHSEEYYTVAQDWWNNEAVKEDLSVPYYDNVNKEIRATYVAHPESNKTVIIGQGWTERPDWIGVVSKVWYDMGYNVLMPSQRGQFASDGNLLSFGYYDKTDWKSLVNKINEMNGDDGEIIFYGQSLGANTALEAASEEGLASNVKAVVADAGYSTLPALGASLYNKALATVNDPLSKLIIPIHFDNIPFLPYEKIMKSVNNINKFLQGFGLDDVSGIVAAAKTTLPAYFITTEDDAFIPDTQSVSMYNANNSAIKKLWILDGSVGGHASANNAVAEYQSNIQAFIDEVNKANNLKVNVEVTNADSTANQKVA